MPSSPLSGVIQQLRAGADRDGTGKSDGELLTRFLSHRDNDALTALVQRHAPMVWGVCRRHLRSYQDAEDAFQATFLVLVRKSATVMPREMVANWLYGVAHQTAVRLRATAAKRGPREMQMKEMSEPVVVAARDDELLSLLDQELSRLPKKFRVLVVLCDLEGKSRKEVARQLGCPEGTVASRLARARGLLAKRLARKGLAISGGSLATMLSQSVTSADVPTTAVTSTIKVASLFAVGQAAGVISGHVAALTEGVLKTMLLRKTMTTAMVALALGLAAMITGGLAVGQVVEKPARIEKPKDQPPMAEQKPTNPVTEQKPKDPAPEKKRPLTPDDAPRMADGGKQTVEFKVQYVTKANLIKSESKEGAWFNGHGPKDICLRPQPPADRKQARFSAILTEKTIEQFKQGWHPRHREALRRQDGPCHGASAKDRL